MGEEQPRLSLKNEYITEEMTVPQKVRSLGDHVLKVGERELVVSVEVGLLDGFVTHQRDLLGRQLPFGQLVQGLLQVLLTDEVVPVKVWTRSPTRRLSTELPQNLNLFY